ncbi:MAG TPA: hypothetical protein VLG71_00775 [Candidatus Limnocylindria bacterium]|nr:hypothetical protein [Candidatus Limnocylindria bacterium]
MKIVLYGIALLTSPTLFGAATVAVVDAKNTAAAHHTAHDQEHELFIELIRRLPRQMPIPGAPEQFCTEKIEKQNCHNTADFVTNLYTGQHDIYHRVMHLDSCNFTDLRPNEYYGTLAAFNTTCPDMAKKLFATTSTPEHFLFYIATRPKKDNLIDHGFVITKKGDGRSTTWYTYQSWYGLFSLAQWLGIDRWPTLTMDDHTITYQELHGHASQKELADPVLFKNAQAQFGNGQPLNNVAGVIQFMLDQTGGYAPVAPDTNYYIRVFIVDTAITNRFQEQIERLNPLNKVIAQTCTTVDKLHRYHANQTQATAATHTLSSALARTLATYTLPQWITKKLFN